MTAETPTSPNRDGVDLDVLQQLRAQATPDPALVSLLPKGKGHGDSQTCTVCGGYHKSGMFHLDYVGHADVTKVLLDADPLWDWQPVAWTPEGLPAFDRDSHGNPVGLWIRLTVGGLTRLGYGSTEASQNDAEKVLIGDALRNAAMRYGLAVDLWSKADRKSSQDQGGRARAPQRAQQPQASTTRPVTPSGDSAPHTDTQAAQDGPAAGQSWWDYRVEQAETADTNLARQTLATRWREMKDSHGDALDAALGPVALLDFADMDLDEARQLVTDAAAVVAGQATTQDPADS